jgi:hypothetical protein
MVQFATAMTSHRWPRRSIAIGVPLPILGQDAPIFSRN